MRTKRGLLIFIFIVASMLPLTARSAQAQVYHPLHVDTYAGSDLRDFWTSSSGLGMAPSSSCSSGWNSISSDWITIDDLVPTYCLGSDSSNIDLAFTFPTTVNLVKVRIETSPHSDHFVQVWNPTIPDWVTGATSLYGSGIEEVNLNLNLQQLYIRHVEKYTSTNVSSITVYWIDASSTPVPTSIPAPTSTPYIPPTTGPTSVPIPSGTPMPSGTPEPLNTMFAQADALPTFVSLDTCNNPFFPCGTQPFPTIALPVLFLPSPTLYPIPPTNTAIPITATPAPTTTPTPAGTSPPVPTTIPAAPSALPTTDISGLNGLNTSLDSSTGMLNSAQNAQFNMGGSSVGLSQAAGDLGSRVGSAFSFMRALELTDFNKAGGVITFLLMVIIFSILVEVLMLVLPVIITILKFVLQAIAALKPF